MGAIRSHFGVFVTRILFLFSLFFPFLMLFGNRKILFLPRNLLHNKFCSKTLKRKRNNAVLQTKETAKKNRVKTNGKNRRKRIQIREKKSTRSKENRHLLRTDSIDIESKNQFTRGCKVLTNPFGLFDCVYLCIRRTTYVFKSAGSRRTWKFIITSFSSIF